MSPEQENATIWRQAERNEASYIPGYIEYRLKIIAKSGYDFVQINGMHSHNVIGGIEGRRINEQNKSMIVSIDDEKEIYSMIKNSPEIFEKYLSESKENSRILAELVNNLPPEFISGSNPGTSTSMGRSRMLRCADGDGGIIVGGTVSYYSSKEELDRAWKNLCDAAENISESDSEHSEANMYAMDKGISQQEAEEKLFGETRREAAMDFERQRLAAIADQTNAEQKL